MQTTIEKKKRVKQVFNSSAVAHVWARQTQSEGRDARRSIYFEGPTIYSYGYHFPIATIVKGKDGAPLVLFTTRDYSRTTSKHKYAARYAVNHLKKIYVFNPLGRPVENVKYIIEGLKNDIQALKNSQRSYTKVIGLLSSIANGRDNLQAYVNYLGFFSKAFEKTIILTGELKQVRRDARKMLKYYAIGDAITQAKIDELRARHEAREEAREAKERAEAEARQARALQRLEGWESGEFNINSIIELDKIYLRVKDGEIQTSKGVRVSIPRARELYYKWLECLECIEGESINGYVVGKVSKWYINIGCHHIEKDQIFKIAGLLGW
jgi:hypothetical protein